MFSHHARFVVVPGLLTLWAWTVCPLKGQISDGVGAPSTVWLGPADYSRFEVRGKENAKASLAVVSLDSPAGKTEGLRFTVHERPGDPIAVQAMLPNPRAVAAMDTLFAHFYARTVHSESDSGEGKIQFFVENNKTYDKSVQFPVTAASDWKEFNLPFAAKGSYQPGEASVAFRLGYQRQTVEVAGLEIRNYGPSVSVASLPTTKPDLSYPGMEPNAPWRAAANERINKIRKAPLTVEVVDAAGRAAAGVTVEVRQTRHAFRFGSAVGAKELLASAEGPDKRYSDLVRENFNIVTLENDLKWPQWSRDRETPLRAARWLKANDITLRGHNMVWPGWRHLPPDLKDLQSKPDELRQAVLRHVEDIGVALRPDAAFWDVVNEAYNNHDLMDLFGQGILTDIYRQARRSAPEARLFINDYGIVTSNGSDHAHQDGYEQTIRYLLDQHAPLEGIGIQGHFGQEFTPPVRIYEILERFAKFGLPIEMTEFTAMADDRQMDANLLRDVMTVFFSHPAVDAFILWDFQDGKGFEHKATLYDASGQLTPAGKVYKDLVFHQWWTYENATTAANGSATVEGFQGRYEVSLTRNGAPTVKQTMELRPGGSTVKVVLGQ